MLYHTPLLIFLLSFDVYSSPVNTPYPGTDNTHPVLSHPIKVSNEVYFGNGQLAQKLNSDDKALKAESACGNAQSACIDGALGICLASKFELSSCPESKRCYQIRELGAMLLFFSLCKTTSLVSSWDLFIPNQWSVFACPIL